MTDHLPNSNLLSEEAFADFYRREHEGQVRRAFLIVGDLATAHDVVANAFIAVYQRWHHIEEPRPYLARCVLNGCRDFGRRNRRVHVAANPVGDWIEQRSTTTAADPTTDPVDELSDVLGALPFRQRAAIVLRFYGGCSEAEIADHLDCRPGTVGSLIHRGLRTLRHQLTPKE